MKKLNIILLVISFPTFLFSYDGSHHISASWGAYNFRYIYPITELEYRSPELFSTSAGLRTEIRSYGTLYFIANGFYEWSIIGEYSFCSIPENIDFYAGAGLIFWIDPVYNMFTSVQPLLGLRAEWSYKRIYGEIPFRLRLYNDGFSALLRVKGGYQITESFGAFLWFEGNFLSKYNFSVTDFRPNLFIGTEYSI